MRQEIVILTVSSKNEGYCVAGIDRGSGKWVRLVSDNTETHGALTKTDVAYKYGGYCKPLDVVEVKAIRNNPIDYQPENVLVDTSSWWKKKDKFTLDELLELHHPEQHSYLLGNKWPYITPAKIDTVGHSLILVKVYNLFITHPNPNSTKAEFTYNKDRYEKMSVTDPDFYSSEFTAEKAILVMSLPDAPWGGKYYKFIAKIFPL